MSRPPREILVWLVEDNALLRGGLEAVLDAADGLACPVAVDRVEAAEEEVHVVGFARAEGGGEFAADEVGDCGGGEVDAVAHAIELGVGLDVFCKLDCGGLAVCTYDFIVWVVIGSGNGEQQML